MTVLLFLITCVWSNLSSNTVLSGNLLSLVLMTKSQWNSFEGAQASAYHTIYTILIDTDDIVLVGNVVKVCHGNYNRPFNKGSQPYILMEA